MYFTTRDSRSGLKFYSLRDIQLKTPILPQAAVERPVVCHRSNSKVEPSLKFLVQQKFGKTTKDFRLPAEALARPAKAGITLGRS